MDDQNPLEFSVAARMYELIFGFVTLPDQR